MAKEIHSNPSYDNVPAEYIIRTGEGGVWGYTYEARGWFTYPESSVLAGQQQEVCVAECDDLEVLKLAYPGVEYDPERSPCEVKPQVSPNAPPDFDYYDAGEHWGEDDY